MSSKNFPDTLPSLEDAIRFHGHFCPGLAMGYRASLAAMRDLQVNRPGDEELVTLAEGDACGLDAVQVVTGCTAGKGNLIVNLLGKHAFTVVRRDTGEGVRVSIHAPSILQDPEWEILRSRVFSGTASRNERITFQQRMEELSQMIMTLPEDQICTLIRTTVPIPRKARIFRSVVCSRCGEHCAEPTVRIREGAMLCLSCFEETG